MAKKVKTKKAIPRATKKRAVRTKAAVKKKKAVKKTAKSAPRKKAVGKKATARKTSRAPKGPPAVVLRPKVPGDAKLYLVFKEDFPARQVFTFLRVETVKELEAYRAREIVERLTAPLVATVERIRERLAENNRFLAGDQTYFQRRCAR